MITKSTGKKKKRKRESHFDTNSIIIVSIFIGKVKTVSKVIHMPRKGHEG